MMKNIEKRNGQQIQQKPRQRRQPHQSKSGSRPEQAGELKAPPKLEYETGCSLDQELPIELFKLVRKIKCLPLLEPKILDNKLSKLKHKRRDIKKTARRLMKREIHTNRK